MSSLSYFLTNRQRGEYINHHLEHTKLNSDFLFKRFSCRKKEVFSVPSHLSDVPYVAKFRKDTSRGDIDILAVATELGEIYLLNADDESGNLVLKNFTAHNNAILDICWLPNKSAFITVSGDQKAILWDATTCESILVFEAHEAAAKCVDVCPGQSAIFATGSKDGTINIWDMRVRSSENFIKSPEITICINQHSSLQNGCNRSYCGKRAKTMGKQVLQRSVTSLAFQDSFNLVSGSAADSSIKVWDLRRTYCSSKFPPLPKHIFKYGRPFTHGCTSMVFDSSHKNLFACCTDHQIHRFNCHDYSSPHISSYYGMKVSSYFVKHSISYDDQYILCGSDTADEKAYIWKVDSPGKPIAVLSGHTSEVTAVSWHPHNLSKFVTCGDDNLVLIWKMSGSESVEEEAFGTISFLSEDPNSDYDIIDQPSSQSTLQDHFSPSQTSSQPRIIKSFKKTCKIRSKPSLFHKKTKGKRTVPSERPITNYFSLVSSPSSSG